MDRNLRTSSPEDLPYKKSQKKVRMSFQEEGKLYKSETQIYMKEH